MEVTDQTHAPASLPARKHRSPLDSRLLQPISGLEDSEQQGGVKMKISLSMPLRKMGGGSRDEAPFIRNLGTTWMRVFNFTQCPFYTLERTPRVH